MAVIQSAERLAISAAKCKAAGRLFRLRFFFGRILAFAGSPAKISTKLTGIESDKEELVDNAEPDMLGSFDTLASSKLLQQSGMPMQQADAVAGVVKNALGTLVTREYLDARLDAQESRAGSRFAEVNSQFGKVDAQFGKVDAQFRKVEAQFRKVDARFEKVDARFEKVDARFRIMDARFDKVDARLDEVVSRLDLDQFKSQINEQLARWALTIVLSQVAISGLLFALLSYTS